MTNLDQNVKGNIAFKQPESLVFLGKNKKIVSTSLKVAEVFGKQHKDILRAIGNLECSRDFGERNFALSSYLSEQSKELPMYEMTRDGFVILVMGFTGPQAMKFKEAYISAFNNLEKICSVLKFGAPYSKEYLDAKNKLFGLLSDEEQLQEAKKIAEEAFVKKYGKTLETLKTELEENTKTILVKYHLTGELRNHNENPLERYLIKAKKLYPKGFKKNHFCRINSKRYSELKEYFEELLEKNFIEQRGKYYFFNN